MDFFPPTNSMKILVMEYSRMIMILLVIPLFFILFILFILLFSFSFFSLSFLFFFFSFFVLTQGSWCGEKWPGQPEGARCTWRGPQQDDECKRTS